MNILFSIPFFLFPILFFFHIPTINGQEETIYLNEIYSDKESKYKIILSDLKEATKSINDPKIHYSLAQLFLLGGNFSEAISEFETAIKLNPKDMRKYYNEINGLIDLYPDGLDSNKYLTILRFGEVLFDNEQYDLVFKVYEKCIKSGKLDIESDLYKNSIKLLKDNKPNHALKFINKSILLNNTDYWKYYLKGKISYKLGNYSDSWLSYKYVEKKLRESNVHSLEDGYGKIFYAEGLVYDRVGQIYYKLGQNDKDLYAKILGIGNCQMGQELDCIKVLYGKALGLYNGAIRFNYAIGEVLFAKGVLYYRLGQYDNALNMYIEAEKRTPDSSNLHYAKGQIYYKFGKIDEAEAEYDKAIKLNPQNSLAKSAKQLLFKE